MRIMKINQGIIGFKSIWSKHQSSTSLFYANIMTEMVYIVILLVITHLLQVRLALLLMIMMLFAAFRWSLRINNKQFNKHQ